MSARGSRRFVWSVPLVLVALPLSACGQDMPGTTIEVEAGPGTCDLSRDSGPGPLIVMVNNVGQEPVTVSVVGADGGVVTTIEDVGESLWRSGAANVYEGEVEIVCELTGEPAIRRSVSVG